MSDEGLGLYQANKSTGSVCTTTGMTEEGDDEYQLWGSETISPSTNCLSLATTLEK